MTKADHGIAIEGARTHNLKGVRCTIPHGALTVVTGVSGSGKSSLAFDTLYAEGQRRFVESLSTYARQFLERMQRPDVDTVAGIPPAIAIEQQNRVKNARSTVGTITEISDYLRLLYARIGVVHCPDCGGQVARDTAQVASDRVLGEANGAPLSVVAPVPIERGDVATRLEELTKQGYRRLFLDGNKVDAAELDAERVRTFRALPILIDRLRAEVTERGRLAEALQGSFALAHGRAEVFVHGREEPLRFDEGFNCAKCGRALKPPTPPLFSFNSPLGACEACQGFGRVIGIDLDKVIPDPKKSIADGAIALFQTPTNRESQEDLERVNQREKKVRLDVPWGELKKSERKWVLDGDPDYKPGGWKKGQWYGVRGLFRYLESKKYKMHVRVLLARYRGYDPCLACDGTRLRPEARAVKIAGLSIAELEALPVSDLRPLCAGLAPTLRKQERTVAQPLFAEIESRLGYLDEVGLGYLTLARQARTLSGGESQRIALASALGAQLTGTLYVLDEPSIGLHPRDSYRLVRVLRKLTGRGNTVVVVEHDPEIMREADHLIDLGPGAGARGGEVVFEGSFPALLSDRTSVTGAFLRGRERSLGPLVEHPDPVGGEIVIRGARAHNLKDLDVTLPHGRFTCLTGVSGSGKSTLLVDVLYAHAERQRGRAVDFVGVCTEVSGLDRFGEVALVDQAPIGRSSRSNPLTYLKAMDELRKRFAATESAERLGLGPGAFSFNVPGGRCEGCQGQGTVTLEMHFLADVTVVCDQCDGKRFSEKVLGVHWQGLSILDCLTLTVDEALERFERAGADKLCARLRPFAEVGLGYLQLGQSTATLSGGESQRLKLAAHLVPKAARGRATTAAAPTLFLFDEPTTGLHGLDVEVLLGAIGRLVAAGHTVIAIEHNLDFIRRADWVVDLGPEGGSGGGELVFAGTPEALSHERRSHTGRALAELRRAGRRRG